MKFKIKKFLPNSLFGRFLLIIVVPTILVQLVAVYMFYDRHWDRISRILASTLAGEIIIITEKFAQSADGINDQEARFLSDMFGLKVRFNTNKTFQPSTESNNNSIFEDISQTLAHRMPYPHKCYYLPNSSDIAFDIALPSGVLTIEASKKRLVNPSTYIFIMWMSGTALVLLVVAIIFMRNQVRPIARLAKAAERFGRGLDMKSFKPSGASEVRKASQAFLNMKARINRQVEQRTEMLAGVSHDLKTPLTRIKLQLAMLEQNKEIKALQEDITELESMVKGYLDFAKGKEKSATGDINIADILRSITAGYRQDHHNISLKIQKGIIIHVNSNSLRRVITNIIDNALKFASKIDINASKSENYLILTFDDDGPGIPPKKWDAVFKPFYRLDDSRNLDKGGTGLGLSIARDIIIGYGGDIWLGKSPMGGLRVSIKIPL